jgi:hypothetical protein
VQQLTLVSRPDAGRPLRIFVANRMSIQDQLREIRYFLYSQAFADGLRTTLAILVPAVAGYYEGRFEDGMSLSLGAL